MTFCLSIRRTWSGRKETSARAFFPPTRPTCSSICTIFLTRDYPRVWLVDEAQLWTEQYLFEAFMTFNRRFRIVGALNYLAHRHPERLAARFPMFRKRRGDPASMRLVSL